MADDLRVPLMICRTIMSAVVVIFFTIIVALSLVLLYVRQKTKWNS